MIKTEEKIIQAAIKEFSQHGFAGARVDRIARLAKINKAMIYYHYRSKEDLYEAILSIFADGITRSVGDIIRKDKIEKEDLYSIISVFTDYICGVDSDFVKIMLREISSGGKYFRKIIFPKTLQPISSVLIENIIKKIDSKLIRPLNPFYLIVQILGSIIFFNIMKIHLHGTEMYKIIYKENYVEEFKQNLITIIQDGIELKEAAE